MSGGASEYSPVLCDVGVALMLARVMNTLLLAKAGRGCGPNDLVGQINLIGVLKY